MCALRVFWALLRALALCPDFGRTLAQAARLLGDLLRLLGVFNLSISKHFSSSRLLDRSGCGHKEQENRARSAPFSTVRRLFKAKSN